MTLPTSGQISFSEIHAEFSKVSDPTSQYPISFSDYYRGGGFVPDIAETTTVPAVGDLNFTDFYATGFPAFTITVATNTGGGDTWSGFAEDGDPANFGQILNGTVNGYNVDHFWDAFLDDGFGEIRFEFRIAGQPGLTWLDFIRAELGNNYGFTGDLFPSASEVGGDTLYQEGSVNPGPPFAWRPRATYYDSGDDTNQFDIKIFTEV